MLHEKTQNFQYDVLKSSAKKLKYLESQDKIHNSFINEEKVLIKNFYSSASKESNIKLLKTSYFNSKEVEKLFAKMFTKSKNKNTSASSKMLLEHFSQNENISFSHIGVSILAKTSDDYLVVLRQGTDQLQSSGLIAPSGSGSVDWNDIENSKSDNLIDLLKHAMCRELSEECNIDYRHIRRNKVKLIGHFQWVIRAYKPEFIGICQLDCPLNMISPNLDEVYYFKGINLRVQNDSQLREFCDVLLKRFDLSLPFQVLLKQLLRIMTESKYSECKKEIQKLWFSD
ncbi:hypothetical protein C1E24_19735 [Pseudoalteromonas phenolica]|uniref:Nudix hydrolase domain-containing protein n=1 Tax=Pseudoalteromonas phenolica TaxID=161398 RepID=A0A5R9PWM6_9GAMM|nr:hypothetical protein [Pseudoalteromonas phenolica]TLX45313.1 hypothetical protein C1E24_19735 [Pseudoalteromonas phenolica]